MGKRFLVFLSFLSTASWACSSAYVTNQTSKWFIKSYDWHHGSGALYVNKRNVRKASLSLKPTDVAAEWTSKFGSVTFSQGGREFPLGGINEKGLVIEIMWLEGSQYATPDSRPSLNELQWIQYQLDNYDSVKDLVDRADDLRISNVAAPVHYFACDTTEYCAALEYLGGQLVVSEASRLPYPTLTNDTYDVSLLFLKQFVNGYGAFVAPLPAGDGSLERFVRASAEADKKPSRPDEVLNTVKNSATQWGLIYDMENVEIEVSTKQTPDKKIVQAAQFDFSCKTPVKMYDINAHQTGPVTNHFRDYTEAENLRVVKEGVTGSGLSLPPGAIQLLASYPNSTRCTE